MKNRCSVFAVFVLVVAASLVRDAAASDLDPYAPRVTAYAPLPKDGLEQLTPKMRETLGRWLAANPPLRTIKLFHCDLWREMTGCEKRLSGKPYVAVEDFNDDGHQDFAVLLERKPNAGPDTLVVFNGPFLIVGKAAFVAREGIDPTTAIDMYGGSGFHFSGAVGGGFNVTPDADGSYDVMVDGDGEEE